MMRPLTISLEHCMHFEAQNTWKIISNIYSKTTAILADQHSLRFFATPKVHPQLSLLYRESPLLLLCNFAKMKLPPFLQLNYRKRSENISKVIIIKFLIKKKQKSTAAEKVFSLKLLLYYYHTTIKSPKPRAAPFSGLRKLMWMLTGRIKSTYGSCALHCVDHNSIGSRIGGAHNCCTAKDMPCAMLWLPTPPTRIWLQQQLCKNVIPPHQTVGI